MKDVDVVVIGSGAGGLTAALSLARAGKKVLVLEQHYLPGGWCHSFSLSRYRFSPGVHYIGELHPGGRMHEIYERLGILGDLEFRELNPDGYDHILVGGEQFDIPKGRDRFAARLKARFPDEAEGIDRYLQTVSRMARELDSLADLRGFTGILGLPFKTPTVARWGLSTARALIHKHVKHPRLRAILAGQAGDHGLPPSSCPAPVHASVQAHYFDGGYYPKGGAAAIPRAYLKALRRHGAELRVRTPVERILMEGRRAVGVRLAGGEEIRAGHVISNADPRVTFHRLVGEQHLSRGLRRKLRKTRWSVSALSLFLATDLDLAARGLDSGNYWIYDSDDVDGIYREGLEASGLEGDMPSGQFVTITTLKDPSKLRPQKGHHTLETFAFVSYDAYRRWAESRYGDRPEEYRALKEDLTRRLVRGAARAVPGLEERVVFAELGTPLTNVHYLEASDGNLYGTEKSRWQIGPWAFPIRTEIRGLSMCGSSTLSHGVAGATVSGLACAALVLDTRMDELLRVPPRLKAPRAAAAHA